MATQFDDIVELLSDSMSVDEIDDWMDTSLEVFLGATPFQMIQRGLADEVKAYLLL